MNCLDPYIENEDAFFKIALKKYEGIDPTFCPIYLTGGIGDVILALDLIRHLKKKLKNIFVYTDHDKAFKYFAPDIGCTKGRPPFSWYLEIDHIAKFEFTTGFKKFVHQESEDLYEQQIKWLNDNQKLKVIHDQFAGKYNLISRFAKENGLKRYEISAYSLGLGFLFFENEAPRPKKKIITIHDGFDAQNKVIVNKRCTKTWDEEKWICLVTELKASFPDYEIIQLGRPETTKADFGAHKYLVGRTTINESFDILATSSLHIDTDSGLTHAATRLGTECIVLFGPTPVDYYGYYENKNLTAGDCQSCYWLRDDWMNVCAAGHLTPQCMDDITIQSVMDKVWDLIQ